QATLGKMLLRIRVADPIGKQISFGRATARHFSKAISTLMLFVGFLMAGWTAQKRTLHDKIAGCLVVANPVQSLADAIARCAFVPLFGVPFGFVAMAWGIARRKENGWKLAALGCGGLSMTILPAGALFFLYFIDHSDQLRTEQTAERLRHLAQSIEHYKSVLGHYPSSLTDLTVDVTNTKENRDLIYDPLYTRALILPQAQTFYYQLDPERQEYYLLSVGKDGKPFTGDDSTPAFSLKNSGLKINKNSGPTTPRFAGNNLSDNVRHIMTKPDHFELISLDPDP